VLRSDRFQVAVANDLAQRHLLIYMQQAKGCGIAAITPLTLCARAWGGVKAEARTAVEWSFGTITAPKSFRKLCTTMKKSRFSFVPLPAFA